MQATVSTSQEDFLFSNFDVAIFVAVELDFNKFPFRTADYLRYITNILSRRYTVQHLLINKCCSSYCKIADCRFLPLIHARLGQKSRGKNSVRNFTVRASNSVCKKCMSLFCLVFIRWSRVGLAEVKVLPSKWDTKIRINKWAKI